MFEITAKEAADSHVEGWRAGEGLDSPDGRGVECTNLDDAVALVEKQDDEIYKTPVHPLYELQPCPELAKYGAEILCLSQELCNVARQKKDTDRRWHDAHLICEELGEFIMAIAECDEVHALDALADLEVVVKGRAGRLGMGSALGEAFLLTMRSNFTKAAQKDDPDAFRIRNKGEGWKPADIAGAFRRMIGREPYKAGE